MPDFVKLGIFPSSRLHLVVQTLGKRYPISAGEEKPLKKKCGPGVPDRGYLRISIFQGWEKIGGWEFSSLRRQVTLHGSNPDKLEYGTH
jgi:hypothetical protein